LRRVRVALATVGLVKVRACPQQPFNLTPEGCRGYPFQLRGFLFSFVLSLFFYIAIKRKEKVQIKKILKEKFLH